MKKNSNRNEIEKFEEAFYRKPQKIACAVKAILQMAISVVMLSLVLLKGLIYLEVVEVSAPWFVILMELRLLKIVSFSLMLAACIEVAYTLFSTEIDKVTPALVMLLTSFVIYQISMIDQMNYFNSVGLLVTVPLIPLLLFFYKYKLEAMKKG